MLGAVWQPDLTLMVEQDFSMISLLMIVYSYEIFSFTTSFPSHKSAPHPSDPHQGGHSPSWTLLVSREGLPKPSELFKAQKESSLTPTSPVHPCWAERFGLRPALPSQLLRLMALQWEPAPSWKTQVEPHQAFPRLRPVPHDGTAPDSFCFVPSQCSPHGS